MIRVQTFTEAGHWRTWSEHSCAVLAQFESANLVRLLGRARVRVTESAPREPTAEEIAGEAEPRRIAGAA
jgi:hypothetical protein